MDKEREIKVPTMRREVEQRVAVRPLVHVVPLAYRDSSIEMVLLVPRKINGLPKVEEELNAGKLAEWLAVDDGWQEVKLKLYLPKLTYESRFDLVPPLRELGVDRGFSSSKSDLSPMFGPLAVADFERPCVSRFLHLAGIRVFEEGTVAYSKTAVVLDWGGGAQPKKLTIRVNHPFLFLIRERKTGLILYMGRVTDPSKR